MARVQGVPCRICTWELVTGFGQNLAEEELVEYFRRDFPDMECLPKFWKMISFNSSDGRRHRYLVILTEEKLQGGTLLYGHRILPNSLFLFARADAQMHSWRQYENFRYAALVNGVLYVIVFYEGRLCHWSEERGYGGACARQMALERLQNVDRFLGQDPLFSSGGPFRYGDLEQLEENFGDPAGTWYAQLQKASRDPFWRGLHLETRRSVAQVALPIILLLLLMVAVFWAWENLDTGCGAFPVPEAPMLTPPTIGTISREPRFGDMVRTPCPKPTLEISGIVGNKLFSGMFAGTRVIKNAGDSLGVYKVKSVLRDRVVLECKGMEWEVLNGAVP